MKNDITQLSKKIKAAQEAYYNDSAIMDDDEYDALMYELSCLDPKNPLLVAVGAEPVEEWIKEKHLTPLGSLNKVNSPSEMTDWITKTLLKKEVLVTEKLDGLSLGCQYQNGKLVKACLRGNGSEGENIAVNALKMQGVVNSVPGFSGTIRGEIILTKTNHFNHFPEYANPRNAASGICRRLDGKGCEHLTLMFYQVIGDEEFVSEKEQFDFLKKRGFKTPNFYLCKSPDKVSDLWKKYQDTTRKSLDYEIDGLVVACNDVAFQQSLGETNLRPKGKMAFKFANQFVSTTIKAFSWEIGGMGRITPRCWFEPVNLLGSTVEKASVYNIAYIEKLGLDIGAKVLICKANEIIPRVEKVIKSTNSVVKPPKLCPSCHSTLVMVGENLTCLNRKGCPDQITGRIENWVKELNILELGKAVIEKLVVAQLVSTPADLYKLTVRDIASLDRMGEKSAQNVYDSIWKNNPITLDLFVGGLSISMIGSSTIRLLIEAGYDNIDKLMNMSNLQAEAVSGIGPIRAISLVDGLKENIDIIQGLLDNGLKLKDKVMGKLTGKSFVFTGAMEHKRAVLEQMVVDNGGTVKSSVGKGTIYLVINDLNSASSKAVNARKLGTKLVSEDEFLGMLK